MLSDVNRRIRLLVAPFAGAWIEMLSCVSHDTSPAVAPFAGAWIEITVVLITSTAVLASLPSRGRGLKYVWPNNYRR